MKITGEILSGVGQPCFAFFPYCPGNCLIPFLIYNLPEKAFFSIIGELVNNKNKIPSFLAQIPAFISIHNLHWNCFHFFRREKESTNEIEARDLEAIPREMFKRLSCGYGGIFVFLFGEGKQK